MPVPKDSARDRALTTPAAAGPVRRLNLRRKQTMTMSTAVFYLQSKPEVDEEYRRIVEAMLFEIINHIGASGVSIGDVETATPTEG